MSVCHFYLVCFAISDTIYSDFKCLLGEISTYYCEDMLLNNLLLGGLYVVSLLYFCLSGQKNVPRSSFGLQKNLTQTVYRNIYFLSEMLGYYLFFYELFFFRLSQ